MGVKRYHAIEPAVVGRRILLSESRRDRLHFGGRLWQLHSRAEQCDCGEKAEATYCGWIHPLVHGWRQAKGRYPDICFIGILKSNWCDSDDRIADPVESNWFSNQTGVGS